MESLSYKALLDAAIAGDGVFYCWWDPDKRNGHAYDGDICTDVVDSTNLFVADVNSSDIQTQKYVMLAGRASVESLRQEALQAGASEADVAKIVADEEISGTYAADLGNVSWKVSKKLLSSFASSVKTAKSFLKRQPRIV